MIQWMARNRLNLWSVHMDNQPMLHKLGMKLEGGSHDAQWTFLSPEAAYPYDHRASRKGVWPKDPYPVSDRYQGDANHDGKLSYFEAHPEWYPLVERPACPASADGSGTNFCTSNADAARSSCGTMSGAHRGNLPRGGRPRVVDAGHGRMVRMPRCKALGSPTDRNLLVVHRLDQEIKRCRARGSSTGRSPSASWPTPTWSSRPTRPLPADFDYRTCTATFFPVQPLPTCYPY